MIKKKSERNCDHYKTAEKAEKAYWAFCNSYYHDSCVGCPFQKHSGLCITLFLFAKYKPEVKTERNKTMIKKKTERNCDHYKTPDEAEEAYVAFCDAHYDFRVNACDGCPFKKRSPHCITLFLFAEYKPEVKQ